jgi:nucleotide-binding universal stress UspA family protein
VGRSKGDPTGELDGIGESRPAGADPRAPGVELTQSIVVGVDGSAGSAAALRWGLAEARLRGAPLNVVHAYELPPLSMGDVAVAGPAGVGMAAVASEDVDRLRAASEAAGQRIIEQTLEDANGDATGVEIERTVIEGAAAPALIDAGRRAALLVLGSRGRGGFIGLLLGSVSQQCAQHPPCPVVILPPVEEEASASGE